MKGKLTFVAKTAGIKINDSDEWINPTPEAKLDIINNIDKIKEWVGCQVELIINDKGNYIGIKKITDKPKKQLTETQIKYKAMSVSYAKDLIVADKIKIDELIDKANEMYKYIIGE